MNIRSIPPNTHLHNPMYLYAYLFYSYILMFEKHTSGTSHLVHIATTEGNHLALIRGQDPSRLHQTRIMYYNKTLIIVLIHPTFNT